MLSWFKDLSKLKKTGVIAGVLFLGMVGIGAASPAPKTTPTTSPTTQVTKTEDRQKKSVTETQTIAFDKTTVDSSSLAKGTSKVTTVGVNGEKTLTYEVTYINGQQTSKTLIKTEITKQPITEVTTVGTYVYVAPATSTGSSSGATAKCNDGSLSYSAHRQGTCSHHGGVAIWY